MFKIGEIVICINKDAWKDNCGIGDYVSGPQYLEEVKILAFKKNESDLYLVLENYEPQCFLSTSFRKKQSFGEEICEKIEQEIIKKQELEYA